MLVNIIPERPSTRDIPVVVVGYDRSARITIRRVGSGTVAKRISSLSAIVLTLLLGGCGGGGGGNGGSPTPPPVDTTPNGFKFNNQDGANQSAVVNSNAITIS